MAIDRRRFLAAALGACVLSPARLLAQGPRVRLLSCQRDRDGRHFLSVLDSLGRSLTDIRLPGRGHGIAVAPSHELAAVFARRPGGFLWVIDLDTCQVRHRITATEGRHYYGHGVFTPDGRRLLCSENAYESGQGRIGVYDATGGFARIGEFASHGIGPHEIRLLSDGATLVAANGGIRTHPDLPRVKSNLSTMRPNLAYVDIRNGQLLFRQEPPAGLHQLSIRHIDVATDDRVAIALQFEGSPTQCPPLIATQQGDEPIRFLTAPDDVQRRMRNYCGSTTFSRDGSRFAVSSPRGGLVSFWSRDGEYLGMRGQSDACGIGVSPDSPKGFLVSDGTGKLTGIDAGLNQTPIRFTPDRHWDNHLVSVV